MLVFILTLLGCATSPAFNVREMYTNEKSEKPFLIMLKSDWRHRLKIKESENPYTLRPSKDILNLDKLSPVLKQSRLQHILDVLVSVSPSSGLNLQVILNKDCNSYSAGTTQSDQIIFCSTILDEASSEDEIAFVLGHELGHVLLQHKKANLYQQKFKNKKSVWLYFGGIGLILISPGYALYSLGALAMYDKWGDAYDEFKTLPMYLRFEEDEADLISIDLLVAASYNPYYAIDAIDKVTYINKQEKSPSKISRQEVVANEMKKQSGWFIIDESVYRHIRKTSDIREHEYGESRAELLIKYIDRFYKYTSDQSFKPIYRNNADL